MGQLAGLKLLKFDLDTPYGSHNNMPLNSVIDTISSAHAALHDQGRSFVSAQPDMAQIALMICGTDISVKSGFSKLEYRMDNIQQTLNAVFVDVHHLKGAMPLLGKV